LTRFLQTNPLSRQLVEGETPIEEDCRYYAHLPYFVDKFIGPGWAQVGDAGGFLDPFYSPGLDQMSFSVWTRTRLILKEFGGARPTKWRRRTRSTTAATTATSSTSTSRSTATSTTSWATTTP